VRSQAIPSIPSIPSAWSENSSTHTAGILAIGNHGDINLRGGCRQAQHLVIGPPRLPEFCFSPPVPPALASLSHFSDSKSFSFTPYISSSSLLFRPSPVTSRLASSSSPAARQFGGAAPRSPLIIPEVGLVESLDLVATIYPSRRLPIASPSSKALHITYPIALASWLSLHLLLHGVESILSRR
jgi:hypothetical protein